jgi:N-methylhydantoinase A
LDHASMGDGKNVSATKPVSNTTRKVLSQGERVDMPLYRVEDQSPGSTGEGPAIIEDPFFTCELLPGWKFEFAANKDILLSKIN